MQQKQQNQDQQKNYDIIVLNYIAYQAALMCSKYDKNANDEADEKSMTLLYHQYFNQHLKLIQSWQNDSEKSVGLPSQEAESASSVVKNIETLTKTSVV